MIETFMQCMTEMSHCTTAYKIVDDDVQKETLGRPRHKWTILRWILINWDITSWKGFMWLRMDKILCSCEHKHELTAR
jgi:hypothetical protein